MSLEDISYSLGTHCCPRPLGCDSNLPVCGEKEAEEIQQPLYSEVSLQNKPCCFLVFINKHLGGHRDFQCWQLCTHSRTLSFCTQVQVSSGQTRDLLLLQFVFKYSLTNFTKAHILTE